MEEQRLGFRLVLFIVAAGLSKVSEGQTQPILSVAFGGDGFNDVTLECRGQSGMAEAATFTFINPLNRSDTFDRSTTSQEHTLAFSIEPENETVVSCRADGGNTESERIAITGE